ncbi:MAG: VWA domain-containing protein [Planctomycetes bacterium]|nr:VWA domain-containing protein [Planctomycetota bacterium]
MKDYGQRFLVGALVFTVMVTCSLSPCFAAGILKPVNGNPSDVFLKSHKVSVTINNGFARTEVDQVFGNKNARDLEAVYSFPIPENASLSELSLWIDGKEVIGEVLERKQARQIYRQETSKRIDPALAEKNGSKTFDITVFPVIAGGDTRMRFVYYQPIKIDLNIGRYVYPLAGGGSDAEQSAFWSIDEEVKGQFSFDLTLKSAFPVKDVRMPGFQDAATIENITKGQGGQTSVFRASLNSEQAVTLNKDIIFYYRLDETAPARVELVPYRRDKSSKGTFMVVVTPAADLKKIEGGSDWVFVLDSSGSMRGTRLNTLIDGVSKSINKLTGDDRFRVIAFSSTARDITKGYVQATPENIEKALKKVRSIKGGGGTELYAGLITACKGIDKKRPTGVIIVTDGVTEIESGKYTKFLSMLEEYDVRLFSFVIGNGGDRKLMERLAKDSGGFAMSISDSDDITGRILQAQNHLVYDNMKNVTLKIKGEKVSELTPQVIGSLFYGQQLVMFGQYDKPGEVEVEMKAWVSGKEKTYSCFADLPKVDTDNPELERLWALSSIEDVMDVIRDEGETDVFRREVIKLGIDYSLVTDYTSMLVITEQSFKRRNIERKNRDRVTNERKAQQQRQSQPVKSYRVDNSKRNQDANKNTFKKRRSPGFGTGSGPVGPLFIGLVIWLKKRKKAAKKKS